MDGWYVTVLGQRPAHINHSVAPVSVSAILPDGLRLQPTLLLVFGQSSLSRRMVVPRANLGRAVGLLASSWVASSAMPAMSANSGLQSMNSGLQSIGTPRRSRILLFHPHLRPPVPGFEEPCPGLERERLVRRLFAWLIPLLAVAACTAGGGRPGPAGHGEMVYRDSAGWTV